MNNTIPKALYIPHLVTVTLTIIGIAGFSDFSLASNYKVAVCDYCGPNDYPQVAVDVGCPWGGDVYVVNRPPSIIKVFATICSYDPEITIEKAIQIDGDAQILNSLNEVLDFYDWLKSFDTVPFGTLPNTPAGVNTAVDLAGNSYRQLQVGNSLSSYISSQFPSPSPAQAGSILSNVPSEITIQFPDGSSYKYRLVSAGINESTGQLEVRYQLIAGTGIDAEGQAIPESLIGLGIRSPVSGTDARDYIDYAERLGALLICVNSSYVELLGCHQEGNRFVCDARVTNPC